MDITRHSGRSRGIWIDEVKDWTGTEHSCMLFPDSERQECMQGYCINIHVCRPSTTRMAGSPSIESKSTVAYERLRLAVQVLQLIERNSRLHQPELCPEDMFSLMLSCWSYAPASRPSFRKIHDILQQSSVYENVQPTQRGRTTTC